MVMEGFVAHKLAEFEQGKISRRRLIETLTLAATAAYAADRAGAAEQPGLKAALVNHISYTCPNFRQPADWYSKDFNLDQLGASARDVARPFAKKMRGRCRRRPVGLLAPAFMDLLFSHPWIDERKRHPAMFSIHCEIGIQRQDGMPFMALGHQHDASVSKRHRRVAIFLKQLA